MAKEKEQRAKVDTKKTSDGGRLPGDRTAQPLSSDGKAVETKPPRLSDLVGGTGLRDLAGLNKKGLRCPKCGCTHFIDPDGPGYRRALEVVNTRDKKNYIRRQRRCRNCGYEMVTVEKIES